MSGATHDAAAMHRRVLLAERDAARRERTLQQLRAELAAAKLALQQSELEVAECLRQIGRLERQLTDLFGSLSWRLGAPVRRAAGTLNRLRAAIGLTAARPLPGPAPPMVAAATAAVLGVREQAILQRLRRG